MYDGNPGEIDFGSSYRYFGSSYPYPGNTVLDKIILGKCPVRNSHTWNLLTHNLSFGPLLLKYMVNKTCAFL